VKEEGRLRCSLLSQYNVGVFSLGFEALISVEVISYLSSQACRSSL